MEYRMLGRTGLKVSAIGVGTEHLVKPSRETVVNLIHEAIDRGVNYFDVLCKEPDYRDNMEAAFRGHRDQAILTGHMFAWEGVEAGRQSLDDLLTRLGTDYVDIVFVSCVDPPTYESAMGLGGLLEAAQDLKRAGKARFIGFSTHTGVTGQLALASGQFDLIMFPVNPAFDLIPNDQGLDALFDSTPEKPFFPVPDRTQPDRRQLYVDCARSNTGLVAMKPFGAGWLFNPRNSGNAALTPAQCLHYCLSQPGMSLALPGVAGPEELRAALAYFDATPAEKDYASTVARARWALQGECMYCNHCLPCPSGIDVGRVLRLGDLAGREASAELRSEYEALAAHASDCIECGVCIERCPFEVDVMERMKQVQKILE